MDFFLWSFVWRMVACINPADTADGHQLSVSGWAVWLFSWCLLTARSLRTTVECSSMLWSSDLWFFGPIEYFSLKIQGMFHPSLKKIFRIWKHRILFSETWNSVWTDVLIFLWVHQKLRWLYGTYWVVQVSLFILKGSSMDQSVSVVLQGCDTGVSHQCGRYDITLASSLAIHGNACSKRQIVTGFHRPCQVPSLHNAGCHL